MMKNAQFFQCENIGILQNIITHIPTGFFVCDLDCKVLYINDVYAQYFDKHPSEIIGKKITDFFEDSGIPDVIQSQKPRYGKIRQIKCGTNTINIIVNRIPLFDENGEICGAMAMALLDKPEQIHNLMLQMDNFRFSEEKKSGMTKGDINAEYGLEHIIGTSPSMQTVKSYLVKYAKVDASVLILGETGTGKELTASALHLESSRAENPYIALNCSAFPKDLFESELFGYSEGAFSGANKGGKRGLIQLAHNGTLFLDEIGELPLDLQAKFLRVLENKKLRPLGSDKAIDIDFRLIAATNRDIKEMVREGTFREDLYYRISPLTLQLPPLAERKTDIPLLVETLLKDVCDYPIYYSKEILDALCAWSWPGNIRELRNVLVRAMSLCQDFTIELTDLPHEIVYAMEKETNKSGKLSKTVKNSETKAILEAIESHEWNVQKTASFLGISRANLYEKMNKLQIKRPNKAS